MIADLIVPVAGATMVVGALAWGRGWVLSKRAEAMHDECMAALAAAAAFLDEAEASEARTRRMVAANRREIAALTGEAADDDEGGLPT